jgi:sec-independent protein translocase protein TatB
MFDVGFSELLMVGLVALLVIGPEKLPKVARLAGFWLGKARNTIAAVKAEISHELYLEENKQLLQNVRSDSEAVQLEIDAAMDAFAGKPQGNLLELLEGSKKVDEA